MELAREVEIGQVGRFESVEAALKSVAKRRLDEYAAGAGPALMQDLADLRGDEPMSVVPQDRAAENGAAEGKIADIVPLRQSSGDSLKAENHALEAELIGAHDQGRRPQRTACPRACEPGQSHEFERALVTIGNLQDKIRSTTASLRECRHHRQLAEQENHRLRKRLRDLGEHIHQPQ